MVAHNSTHLLPVFFVFLLPLLPCAFAAMVDEFFSTSNNELVHFDSQEISLSLDQSNSSGFQSYNQFLFGYFNMQIKLIPGDSAGTVTTYYLSSLGPYHDELDFEFLGNMSGEPCILQTNVYANGVGGREQRIFLWFDPTADFHNYTLIWNEELVVFLVDNTPIRIYPNIVATTGLPFLHNQSMFVYATIWDGDSWATEGGRIKINWTHAPFTARYQEFIADACSNTATTSATECAAGKWWNQASLQELDSSQISQMKTVQEKYMAYNYCTDTARYNVTPPECLFTEPMESVSASPSSSATSPAPLSSIRGPSSSPSPVSSLDDNSSPSPSPQSAFSLASKAPLDLFFSLCTIMVYLLVNL